MVCRWIIYGKRSGWLWIFKNFFGIKAGNDGLCAGEIYKHKAMK
jgi:hypothetical protein